MATKTAAKPKTTKPPKAPKTASAEKTATPAPAKTTKPADAIGSLKMVAERLKMASDGTRLHLLLSLDESDSNVGDLCEGTGHSQPAISHHLALLRHGGLVSSERNGKESIYSLTETGRGFVKALAPLVEL